MRSSLAGCAVVMAHPDDEVLWASSVLARSSKIILCFGDLLTTRRGEARRGALNEYPIRNLEFLDLPEAGVFDLGGWPNPRRATFGVEIDEMHGRHALPAARYQQNYDDLCNMLMKRLRGIEDVVTHNPWGEYGHEDHVQVFSAVLSCWARLGFRMWVSNYVSYKSLEYMLSQKAILGRPMAPLRTDSQLARELQKLYSKHGAWTWPEDYIWPDFETYFPILVAGDKTSQGAVAYPLNFFGGFWSRPSKTARILSAIGRISKLKEKLREGLPHGRMSDSGTYTAECLLPGVKRTHLIHAMLDASGPEAR